MHHRLPCLRIQPAACERPGETCASICIDRPYGNMRSDHGPGSHGAAARSYRWRSPKGNMAGPFRPFQRLRGRAGRARGPMRRVFCVAWSSMPPAADRLSASGQHDCPKIREGAGISLASPYEFYFPSISASVIPCELGRITQSSDSGRCESNMGGVSFRGLACHAAIMARARRGVLRRMPRPVALRRVSIAIGHW